MFSLFRVHEMFVQATNQHCGCGMWDCLSQPGPPAVGQGWTILVTLKHIKRLGAMMIVVFYRTKYFPFRIVEDLSDNLMTSDAGADLFHIWGL